MQCLYPQVKKRTLKGDTLEYSHRCGSCLPCLITRKQEWTLRIELEAKTHFANSFVTLTYDEDSRSPDCSLNKKHLQDFFKRLRKRLGYKVRYFACGEYGEQSGREHYHAIVFGLPWLESESVQLCWPFGHADVRDAGKGSSAYVAGYVTKKLVHGKQEVSEEDNNYYADGRLREFTLMSRNPGVGVPFIKNLVGNMTTHKLNFIGEDYKYLRINGMMLPLDAFMKSKIDKELGFHRLEKSRAEQLVVDLVSYKEGRYEEYKADLKHRARRKAMQKQKLQKMRQKF